METEWQASTLYASSVCGAQYERNWRRDQEICLQKHWKQYQILHNGEEGQAAFEHLRDGLRHGI